MKRVWFSVAAAMTAATVMGGVANAADIRQPPVVKAPAYMPPAVFSWTGFYIGGNVGYGWSDGSGTLTVPGVGTGPISGSGDGLIGGGQIGYNWQTGVFVLGIEADFQGSGGSGTVRGRLGPAAVPVVGTARNDWFGTIRGRLGYAADRWLFYVTGGGAFSENSVSGTVGGIPSSASATGWSWTIGGGIEAALYQNWSVKGEYLFISTPDQVPVLRGGTVSGNIDSHVVRVGLNYHF